ncbi:MAG: alpha/beta fold hydrolase [Enhygromyxa sp.]
MTVPPRGHWWTIAPNLLGRLRPGPIGDAPWSTPVTDPRPGATQEQRIAGALGGPARGELFLLVHGLGGDADSPYMRLNADALQARGYATLRMSMRGTGQSCPDYYHAGLAGDLVTVLADPSLAAYERIFVMGFSLGGHVSMHLSFLAERDPRVAAILAICAPLDLERNVIELDTPSGWIYRRYVLNSLQKLHTRLHPGERRRFATIREWDATTVVPRYGFESPEHYWRSQAAGPRLREAGIPILYVGSQGDPMVPVTTVESHLARAGGAVDIRWVRRGGHVGFPRDIDLGLPGELGLIPQILTWVTTRL